MLRLISIIITLVSRFQLTSGDWYCGGVKVYDDSICVCGDTNTTWSDWRNDDDACCGRDTCYVDQDGNGQCPDGHPCRGSRDYTFRCGDTRLSETGYCWCGINTILTKDDYRRSPYRWCCPSSLSSCSYQNGDSICINGAVNTGIGTRCPSGVTYSGKYRNYRDNFYCEDGLPVERDKICQGSPRCKDGTDLDQCQKNNEFCKYDFSKCGVTLKEYSNK